MVFALRPPVYVGFDAASLSGAALARGFGGRRLQSFARIPLSPDVLAPSAVSRNILRPEEVRDALRRLRQQLGRGGPATLVLPDGVARLALLEVEGQDLRDYARFRLGPGLPYPLTEAVVDVLPVGPGRAPLGSGSTEDSQGTGLDPSPRPASGTPGGFGRREDGRQLARLSRTWARRCRSRRAYRDRLGGIAAGRAVAPADRTGLVVLRGPWQPHLYPGAAR